MMALPKDIGIFLKENEREKKTKMRTASDVISRLLWDENLPREEFVVGYLDRFKGIVEEKFTNLNWDDLATVDNFTLAIPKHRIQYFRYKNKKVWDKNSRLDIIYGSTGDNRNIKDFIKAVDKIDEGFFDEDAFDNLVPGKEKTACEITKEEDAYDSSSRSNFFVAIRITDQNTLESLSELRGLILLKDEELQDCCVLGTEYHLTLLTIRLNSLESIEKAVRALHNVKFKIPTLPKLELEGVDVFRYRVLYSIVKHDDLLIKLRDCLIDSFIEQGINMLDKFMFVPHVTVMKLSRPIVRSRHCKFIEPYLYVDFENTSFGIQEVTTLSLCEMGNGRREDGFYNCITEIDLS